MTFKYPIMRTVIAVVIMTAAFIPLLFVTLSLNETSQTGDFYQYFNWAKAFNKSDIFCLTGNILSPKGIPLNLFSFGPGLIFSLGGLFGNINMTEAVFVGWLFVIVFWISYSGILLCATNNNHSLMLFGVCITFIGTPLGYYTSAYASETLSYTCLSVMIWWIISRNNFNVLDYLFVGIWSSLLILVRSQLVLYVVPVYLVILYRLREESRSEGISVLRSVVRGSVYHLPILLALAMIFTVNDWMTGSPHGSVYNFGSGDFKSVDFSHPELMAVLLHPFHGLLVYHPLYLIGFVALMVLICKQGDSSQLLLLVVTALVIMAHIYLHASWYVWWLGMATFGMRGLSICAIVLVPLLLRLMSEREERGKSNTTFLIVILLVCLWSFTLLTQGTPYYFTYQQLFAGVNSALDNLISLRFHILPVVLFVLGLLATFMSGASYRLLFFENVVIALLLLLIIHYQITMLLYDRAGMGIISLLSLVLWLIIWVGYHLVIEEFQNHSHLFKRLLVTFTMLFFSALGIIFVNLMVKTDRMIVTKAPAPLNYTYIGTVDMNEIRAAYKEYGYIPDFVDQKNRLNTYIKYLDSGNDNALQQRQKGN